MEPNNTMVDIGNDCALYVRRSFFEHGVTVPLVTSAMLKTEALTTAFEELFNMAMPIDNKLTIRLDQWTEVCNKYLGLSSLQSQHIVHTLQVVSSDCFHDERVPFVELLVFVRLQACARRLATPVRPSTDDVFPKSALSAAAPFDDSGRSSAVFPSRVASPRLEKSSSSFYRETMFIANNLQVVLNDVVRLYETVEKLEKNKDKMETEESTEREEMQSKLQRLDLLNHLDFLFLATVDGCLVNLQTFVETVMNRLGIREATTDWLDRILGSALKMTAQQSSGVAPQFIDKTLELSQLSRCTVLRSGTEEEPLNRRDVRIRNCQEAYVYLLNGMNRISIESCSDCTIFIGAAFCVSMTSCERMKLVAASRFLRITNVVDTTSYLCVNHRPGLLGDNRGLRFAPFNAFYPSLEEHMRIVGVEAASNHWNEPFVIEGSTNPLPSVASILPPDQLTPFAVPVYYNDGQTKKNPVTLPKEYLEAAEEKTSAVDALRALVRHSQTHEHVNLERTIQFYFRDWLISSGNIRQIHDLVKLAEMHE
eukprot:jgi/Galph1/193/GphlegSOOS_G4949.1